VLAALLAVPATRAQQADRERIIDIDQLNTAITRATDSIAEPLGATRLGQIFTHVNELLAAETVDKRKLVRSLQRLSAELDQFVHQLDTSALFEAERQVGETIDRIRAVMASGPAAATDSPLRHQIVEHERQLRELVTMIDNETDSRRQRRLKIVFAHHLRLKRLKEQMGTVDLSDARMRVLARTAEALDQLSTRLVSAAFRTEEARMVMSEQSRFLGAYVEILEGVVDAEAIARVLQGLGGSGSKLSGVIADLTVVAAQAAEFGERMDTLSLRLADQIELMGDGIATEVERSNEAMDIDIEQELARYRAAID